MRYRVLLPGSAGCAREPAPGALDAASSVATGPLPPRLQDLAVVPERLHLWGELPPEPYVALVGTRRATREALDYTRRLAGELTQAGVTVISGGAEGVDTAAHWGALDAGGPTLVVSVGSLERAYPEQNRELFAAVVRRGGGFLSLQPSGSAAERHQFFERNGVLAALARAVVVVEAPLRSGARNAAKQARELGRALFAVPAAAWNPQGRGSNLELRLGARWLESPKELLGFLRESGCWWGPGGPSEPGLLHEGAADGAPDQLSLQLRPASEGGRRRGEQRREGAARRGGAPGRGEAKTGPSEQLWALLERGVRDVDGLCAASGLPASVVQATLLELTLDGRIEVDTTGALRVCVDAGSEGVLRVDRPAA